MVDLPDGRQVLQKDPELPAVLEDPIILYGLNHSQRARDEFSRLYPSLNPRSQERLAEMILRNPRESRLLRTETSFCDALQRADVTSGIVNALYKRVRSLYSES